ncbi:hypothetical protein ACIA8K_38715 [Catenuloplanes sp. NPDC051500]|uniref:hypothetical protein n=1 Tax=Catenuloplanes sp. NPDC051500 TaxID=3363959 RepID=UPI00378A193E
MAVRPWHMFGVIVAFGVGPAVWIGGSLVSEPASGTTPAPTPPRASASPSPSPAGPAPSTGYDPGATGLPDPGVWTPSAMPSAAPSSAPPSEPAEPSPTPTGSPTSGPVTGVPSPSRPPLLPPLFPTPGDPEADGFLLGPLLF